MKNDRPADVADAMDDLVRGYEEEFHLYTRVRNLTWKQRVSLRDGQGLDRFSDLLDEKQDLLRMIAEIESHLHAAKSVVVSRKAEQCPNRLKLEAILDGLTATIEDIRVLENANVLLLHCPAVASRRPRSTSRAVPGAPAAAPLLAHEAARAGA